MAVPELIARDADLNAKLSYSIAAADDDFSIKEEDGRVFVIINKVLGK